jgi:hypothetical protein
MGFLHRTSALVRRPVTYRDIRLGVAVDALFDRAIRRLVGLEVRCGDGVHRLLPFPACEVRGESLRVDSPLVLLEGNVDFYRLRGCTFEALLGTSVALESREAGLLADLLVTGDGEVRRVVVAGEEGPLELDPAAAVLGDRDLRPAV